MIQATYAVASDETFGGTWPIRALIGILLSDNTQRGSPPDIARKRCALSGGLPVG